MSQAHEKRQAEAYPTKLVKGEHDATRSQGDPNYYQYTRSKPRIEEVAGVWRLDLSASDWKPAVGVVKTPTIELKLDGTSTVRDIPDVWNWDNRHVVGGYDSGDGTWSLRQDQQWGVVHVSLPKVNGMAPGRSYMLFPTGQSTPYTILARIGDPDEGRALTFRREQPAP